VKGIPTFEFLAQRRRDAELFLTELTEFEEFSATDGGAKGIGMGVQSFSAWQNFHEALKLIEPVPRPM
jgi:hypothetical protein